MLSCVTVIKDPGLISHTSVSEDCQGSFADFFPKVHLGSSF